MWCFGVSGHEILLAVAVFCFAWQRRMSLGQGGVEWGGGEESGFALYILIYWSRLIDGRALYRVRASVSRGENNIVEEE